MKQVRVEKSQAQEVLKQYLLFIAERSLRRFEVRPPQGEMVFARIF